jgi:3-phosphoshikimate 1-carboxyvinyltransferase
MNIGESKSILNRVLVLASYTDLQVNYKSQAKDVLELDTALKKIENENNLSISEGGTSLRFLILRLSRLKGQFYIKLGESLLRRPNLQVQDLLAQLGVELNLKGDTLILSSDGWKISRHLTIDCEKTSQFASALLLNTINLEKDLHLRLLNLKTSQSYVDMTLQLLHQAGIHFVQKGNEISIPKKQMVKALPPIEMDMSSFFSLNVVNLIRGRELSITPFYQNSIQPDIEFLKIFKAIGIQYKIESDSFCLKANQNLTDLNPIEWNLNQSIDLFPVLSILCCLIPGTSKLLGLENLKYKESDRLKNICALLSQLKIKFQSTSNQLLIQGGTLNKSLQDLFLLDPDHDHRMAFAGACLKAYGLNIKIKHPEVVAKSYPTFWDDTGLSP